MFRSWLAITFVLLLGQISTLCGQENYSTRQVQPNDQSPLPIQQTNSFIPLNSQTIFTGWDGKSSDDAQSKNGTESKNGKEDKKFVPKHIRDNAFLVEEAFNQEPGDVQHIFNWINQWDRTIARKTRDFAFAYTMELPLGSQAHQFSFTTQILSAFDAPIDGQGQQPGGIGDTFLNYRYQLLADDEFVWCAPRFTVILPTGDRSFGLGTGELGYQFNLPISHYGDVFDFHFNIGATFTPSVSTLLDSGILSAPQGLRSYNLGASAFWKPKTNLNFFVETLALSNEEINDLGTRDRLTLVYLNPGVRYAICQLEEVEWVVGVSAPIGLTKDTPDIGLFIYMSIEFGFKKKNDE